MHLVFTTIVFILLVILHVLLYKLKHVSKTTHFEHFASSEDTIFVSVAAYRDKNCPRTLESLYTNAAHPENIIVGLCQQNMPNDVDCAINDQVPEKYRSQIRTIRVLHYDAQGPTWARYLCSTLLHNEKYYLQIDSHCLFSKDWDVKLVGMIKALKKSGVKKPMLSHYTREHEAYDSDDRKDSVPAICQSFFNDDKMISFLGAEDVTYKPGELPLPNAYAAAGMMFAESKFTEEVPYDPRLPYLFVGEEILHSIRLWTHGWDLFTPSENVIFHYYTREEEPKIWTDVTYTDADAVNKVRNILDLEGATEIIPYLQQNLDKYGLGKERTLQQYFEYAGIDKVERKVKRNFCHDPDIRQVYKKYQYKGKGE
jgi:hypothetical protein